MNQDKNQIPKHITFLAGGIAGAMGTVVTQPLDVIKTRLQSANKVESITKATSNKLFFKTFTSLKLTYQREGVRGIFRGILPNLMGISPSRALYFTVYDNVKNYFSKNIQGYENGIVMSSACIASLTVYTVMNPVWLVKTRIQVQEHGKVQEGSPNYKGYIDCIQRVFKEEGIRGFYKGLTASYMGVFESSLYFLFYEFCKKNYKQEYQPFDYMAMAAVCKFGASAITYPHEVVRTRMRELVNGKSLYSGVFDAFFQIAKKEKIKGLYAGMSVHLLKSVPNAAIMFFVYEAIINFYKERK